MHSKFGTAYDDMSKEKKQMSRPNLTKTCCTVKQDVNFVKVDLKNKVKLLHPSVAQSTGICKSCCKSYKPHLTFHLQD